MQFSDAWLIAKRWWVLIILCAVVGAAFSSWRSSDASPVYSSVSQVFINGNAPTVKDAVDAGELASSRGASYAALLRGPELVENVIDKLHLDMTPAELAVKIDPDPDVSPDAVVLGFSVSDTDPEKAQQLSATVADELCALVERLETPPNGSSPLIVARPVGQPGTASLVAAPTTRSRSIGLGLLVGAIVGFGLAVLVDRSGAGRRKRPAEG